MAKRGRTAGANGPDSLDAQGTKSRRASRRDAPAAPKSGALRNAVIATAIAGFLVPFLWLGPIARAAEGPDGDALWVEVGFLPLVVAGGFASALLGRRIAPKNLKWTEPMSAYIGGLVLWFVYFLVRLKTG